MFPGIDQYYWLYAPWTLTVVVITAGAVVGTRAVAGAASIVGATGVAARAVTCEMWRD